MSKTALDINALDLDYALAGETEIYIVPIVAPILRAGYSRGDAVENFKQILGSDKIVQSFDVKIQHNDTNTDVTLHIDTPSQSGISSRTHPSKTTSGHT